ncbi:hypothetical protein RI845_02100 [Thalassotalea nanhaiensis]|uniref:DUF805 domain-containing protein n=1 Tax=Thalassotalea nanhaiensis TaxID=3065648 RepID=A0ABY9TJD7_9GAMM|nr:hypothetical protein RI845_02100 [Colwelliaceae bacterium SQ345]
MFDKVIDTFIASIMTVFFVLVFVTISYLIFGLTDSPRESDLRDPAILFGVIAAIISGFVVIVWAIPIHAILSRHNKNHVGWYIALAMIPSFGLAAIFTSSSHPLLGVTEALFHAVFIGVPASIVFWYFAAYDNVIADDRSERSAT